MRKSCTGVPSVTDTRKPDVVSGGSEHRASLYEALVGVCSDAVLTITPEGIIASWNPAAERFFGYQAEEIIGQPVVRLTPEALSWISSGQRDITVLRKDGRPFTARVTISPVHDVQGTFTGALVVMREIIAAGGDGPQDSQQLLRAAGEINRIYRSAIENLSDCLNVKDASGRFLIANEATAELMQAPSAADLIGKTDFDFYPREVAEAFLADERKILNEGVPRVIEQEAFRRDGSKRVPFNPQGAIA